MACLIGIRGASFTSSVPPHRRAPDRLELVRRARVRVGQADAAFTIPCRQPSPAFRVPTGSAGVKAQLGVVRSAIESAECVAVSAVGPGNDPAFQLGYIVGVDSQLTA